MSASPLGVIANRDGPDYAAISTLVEEWRPTSLVVGMPSHTDGSPSKLQGPIDAFIAELQRFGLDIDTVDERYTSIEAAAALKASRAAGGRGRISKEMIDSKAAVFIAERYFSSG